MNTEHGFLSDQAVQFASSHKQSAKNFASQQRLQQLRDGFAPAEDEGEWVHTAADQQLANSMTGALRSAKAAFAAKALRRNLSWDSLGNRKQASTQPSLLQICFEVAGADPRTEYCWGKYVAVPQCWYFNVSRLQGMQWSTTVQQVTRQT